MLKIDKLTTLLGQITQDHPNSIASVFLFDYRGNILASSGLSTQQSQLVKTAISTWIDFADLEGSDDQSNNEIMTMTLELEKNYLLISDLERSGFFVGILAGDKRPETLGESTRVCSAWSRKLSSQFSQLYYRFEEQPAN